jgi:CHRD domain
MLRVTRVTAALLAALAAVGLGMTTVATADGDHNRSKRFRAFLAADNEIPTVISDARGRFSAELDDSGLTPVLRWRLSYEGLEGAITQAHIHVAQKFANGAIVIWLCANNPPITTAPAGTPPCPAAPGEVEGESDATDIAAVNQAIPAGGFDDVIEAIRTGNAYANVHTAVATGGEIRGQIRERD